MNNSDGPLDVVARSLEPEESAAVRAWLGANGGPIHPRAVLRNLEPVPDGLERPDPQDADAIRTIGVIGGGTAGYLTALALQAKRPWLDVTIVESKDIPIIGVGEATVPNIQLFLHHYLGIDPTDFYARVKPTWKLGIRFEWGPDSAGFMAPFDWGAQSIGALGSLREHGSINGFSVESLLMMADRTPVIDVEGSPVSLMKYLPFAYHLDNVRFVRYLTELAERRGIRHVDAVVTNVARSDDGWVDRLQTADGRELRYDFYIDCTGFRSMLLGKALETPFETYASSLFTDSAVTGNRSHCGQLKPYTMATTMDAGWCWTIPVPESDHLGYVYSSAAISHDAAAAELRRRFPGVDEPKLIRFTSGRHRHAWRGNVMAVGNAYAFVEPLESTALQMMTLTIVTLVSALPLTWAAPTARDLVNKFLADRWDALRWFLSIHYRFNTRLDTPFWKQARSQTDVSGWQPLLDIFATGAPLSRRDPLLRRAVQRAVPSAYGLPGVDNILLGQHVPTRLLPPAEPPERWQARSRAADALVRRALPQREALAAFITRPELLQELFDDRDSWAARPGLADAQIS